mmetsp:Transcript_4106/g.4911  ORF Transcript_4106/g.4911 Transcript_4106/m.4911 type:complete len:220 (+) Transcript_4106:42-701(+)
MTYFRSFVPFLAILAVASGPGCSQQALAFTSSNLTPRSFGMTKSHERIRYPLLHASSREENEKTQKEEFPFPLLPAIGSSSYDASSSAGTDFNVMNNDSGETNVEKPSVVGEKFELQYTCKVCDTRNSHRVSRIAYRTGVVIAVCKGCHSKHLIADNLGWHNYIGGFEGDANIEEYFANRGLEEEVNRVSKDVFELEKVLGIKTGSGSIVGDDGEPAME